MSRNIAEYIFNKFGRHIMLLKCYFHSVVTSCSEAMS